MPKPTTQKSQLSGIVLISFIILGTSTVFSLSKEENNDASGPCVHEMEGKISISSSDNTQLIVTDNKGNDYFKSYLMGLLRYHLSMHKSTAVKILKHP